MLKHGFNMLDRDKSGKISLKNLRDLMVAMGKYEDEDALREMMRRFDLFKVISLCCCEHVKCSGWVWVGVDMCLCAYNVHVCKSVWTCVRVYLSWWTDVCHCVRMLSCGRAKIS